MGGGIADIEEGKIAQPLKQRPIGAKMIGEAGEAGLPGIDVRKSRQRSRGIGPLNKQRKLIDEVPQRWSPAGTALIALGGKHGAGNGKFLAEEAEFIGFGFEVYVRGMGENEIEQQQACAHELNRVALPVAEILVANPAVDGFGNEMIDTTGLVVFAPRGMAATLELSREMVRPLAPFGATGGEELAGYKVSGMHGHDIDKASLFECVAERDDCREVFGIDVHRERISAVSSCWSSTRRRRSASPRGVYSENPAHTLSAMLR